MPPASKLQERPFSVTHQQPDHRIELSRTRGDFHLPCRVKRRQDRTEDSYRFPLHQAPLLLQAREMPRYCETWHVAMKPLLHRHSTLFGFLASIVVAFSLGVLTHWVWPIVGLSALAGIFVFPRAFYGRAESRALDKDQASPDSFFAEGGSSRDMAGIGSKAFMLDEAYNETRLAGTTDTTRPVRSPIPKR